MCCLFHYDFSKLIDGLACQFLGDTKFFHRHFVKVFTSSHEVHLDVKLYKPVGRSVSNDWQAYNFVRLILLMMG